MYSTEERPRGAHGQFVIKQRTVKICPECRLPKDINTDYYQRKDKNGRLYPNAHCKGCTKTRLRAWASNNRSRVLEANRNQYRKHKTKIMAAQAIKVQNLRLQCVQKLGGKCSRLGCTWIDIRALQIDHVHGDGKQDRKSVRHQAGFYRKVLADTQGNYQVLCANHNIVKKYENYEGVSHHHPLAKKTIVLLDV